jgi:hypothetical protein
MPASPLVLLILMALLGTPITARSAPGFFSAFNAKNGPLPDVAGLPLDLVPVVEFERILFKIRTGEKVEEWRAKLQRFTDAKAEKGVPAALRELALAWEARARMLEWDSVLRDSYRHKGRFPDSVDSLLPLMNDAVQKDPWGDAWVYAVTAPQRSPQLTGQRYVIGPQRYPNLSPLEDACRNTPQPPPGAVLAYSAIATVISLQIDSRIPQPSRAFKQLGERFGAYWVLWFSREGALLSNTEGFVPVTFK